LLSFWEDYIPAHLPPSPSPEHLAKQYQDRSPAWWDKLPTELFRDWGKEVAEIVCSQVYAAMEVSNTDGSRKIDSPFRLEEEIFQRWVQLANDFTILGGQRLAWVLTEIIEHRKHKVAHRSGRGRHHRKQSWQKGFLTNALIAVCVVPTLLLVLRWHAGSGAPSLMGFFRQHLKT